VNFISVTIQMKTIEQCFPVVLFIVLYKVALSLESVDEFRAKLSCETLFCCTVNFIRIIASWSLIHILKS